MNLASFSLASDDFHRRSVAQSFQAAFYHLVVFGQPFKDLRPISRSQPDFDGLLARSFAVNDDEDARLSLPFNDAFVGQDESVRNSLDNDFAASK